MTSKVRCVGSDGHHMQFTRTFCATLLLTAALTAPAAAQLYPGDDVTVNTGAAGRTYLLYPGGQYGRSVPQLLQPGEKPGGVIRLHMPTHRPRVASSHKPKPAPVASLPASDVAPVSAPTRKAVKPAKQATVTSDPGALPEDSAARLVGASAVGPAAKPPARPVRTAATPPPAASAPSGNTGATTVPFSFGGPSAAPVAANAAPAPVKTASATAPVRTTPSGAVAAGLKKQTMIPFAAGASSPASTDVNAIHALAASLSTALSAGAIRVQLDAYGGPRGDKSSDSRRLSLKRALVVRELLIEDGVPSEKIDVRAMGGADDSGATDRVDVFVRG
ncbi:MAG: hypothetical protein ACXWLK_01280 [Rhizomicrobium sp.]